LRIPRDCSLLGCDVLCVCSAASAGLFDDTGIDGQGMQVLRWACCEKNAWVHFGIGVSESRVVVSQLCVHGEQSVAAWRRICC